ncbi:hypothetical protein HK103_006887 [Boothiomyces macroporosus]|uniref:4-nitrophenylphosphatase n=1 Tax=Boothiomyces macroporosus TaxID=261099 RepID=A0AAD5Y1S4_9FUNG|nr:hypothetical protein HK103_006887 [Boothiomyces macroporosus]
MNLKEANHLEFVSNFDTFLFDCDGVIWQGNDLIPGVKQVLLELRKLNKQILFVSNNSTKSRKSYLKKFESLGIQASVDEVFGSAYCAAYYMKHQLAFPPNKQVYVVGMHGICDELESQGIKYCGSSDDNENIKDMAHIGDIKHESDVGAVLFGFDVDLNYKKLAKAFTYLQDRDCLFLATNSDLTYPAAGTIFPGTGALLAALSAPLERQPIVLGKPHQTMLDCIVDSKHLNRERTCMVGDRLDTDIAFGKLGKLKTLLVMTGVTNQETLNKTDTIPDYVIDSLGSLKLIN